MTAPGWTVVEGRITIDVEHPTGRFSVGGKRSARARANAHLIAAAPALLAACRMIRLLLLLLLP